LVARPLDEGGEERFRCEPESDEDKNAPDDEEEDFEDVGHYHKRDVLR
jgi:hypothetical protein